MASTLGRLHRTRSAVGEGPSTAGGAEEIGGMEVRRLEGTEYLQYKTDWSLSHIHLSECGIIFTVDGGGLTKLNLYRERYPFVAGPLRGVERPRKGEGERSVQVLKLDCF